MFFLKKKSLKSKENEKIAVQTALSSNEIYPYSELSNREYLIKHETKLYNLLRDAVPIIDAAINKTVRLIGNFKIRCQNEEIEKK